MFRRGVLRRCCLRLPRRFGRSSFLRLCRFLLAELPFGNVVDHAAGFQPRIVRQLLRRQLIQQRRLLPLKQRDALPVVQPQYLVGLHQLPRGVAPGLRIRPCAGIDRREQRHKRHLVVGHGDRHPAALLRQILRRRVVVAAHVERLVKGCELVFPLLAGILLLPLRQTLHDDLAAHVEAADAVERVRHAVHVADVAVFVEAEVHQHRQPSALAAKPRIVRELRDRQREKQ